MVNRQNARRGKFEEIDEHDQPTEPMAKIVLAPLHGNGIAPSGDTTIADRSEVVPAPQPQERPFPRLKPSPTPAAPPLSPSYPFLPPSPMPPVGDRPAGGATPGARAERVPRRGQNVPRQPRLSVFPVLIGLIFVGVQLLLLARFVLRLVNVQPDTNWVSIIYGLSAPLAAPFQALLQSVVLPFPANVELYTLLAILVYGIFSRILVRFLKAILNSR